MAQLQIKLTNEGFKDGTVFEHSAVIDTELSDNIDARVTEIAAELSKVLKDAGRKLEAELNPVTED